jgi:hypothetical protein
MPSSPFDSEHTYIILCIVTSDFMAHHPPQGAAAVEDLGIRKRNDQLMT